MRGRNLAVPFRSVDFAARPRNDLPIPEVIDQRLVVGVEQASAADQRQRYHVLIVRGADVTPAERLRTTVDILVNHGADAPVKTRGFDPLRHFRVLAQFLSKPSAKNQLAVWSRSQSKNRLPAGGRFSPKT